MQNKLFCIVLFMGVNSKTKLDFSTATMEMWERIKMPRFSLIIFFFKHFMEKKMLASIPQLLLEMLLNTPFVWFCVYVFLLLNGWEKQCILLLNSRKSKWRTVLAFFAFDLNPGSKICAFYRHSSARRIYSF